MTDEQGGGTAGPGIPVTRSQVPPAVSRPKPGWYPDPWMSGHHRYWNGVAWTGDAFPDGPAGPPDQGASAGTWAAPGYEAPAQPAAGPWVAAGAEAAVAPPAGPWTTTSTVPPPPPAWSPPSRGMGWDVPPAAAPTRPPGPPGRSLGRIIAVLVLVALVIGSLSFAGAYFALRNDSKKTATAPLPTPTVPSSPVPSSPGSTPPSSDPSASVLSRMVVSQNDVASSVVVQPINQGQSLGQPTLDLCNGTYPSESLRTARLQVLAVDGGGNALLSTEAVLYNNPASATQGFSELASTASKCPSSPVNGVTTHFNAAPDGSWPQVAGVQRQAYDFTSTDQTGQNQHSVAVYLRRGRALLGVYFSQPDGAQSSVAGQTTIPTILNVFANRLAALPAGAIGA